MEIRIQLKNSYGRLAQREPFLITDEPLPRITFETDYVLADAIVTLKNEYTVRKLRLKNITDGFNLTPEFMKAGLLDIQLTLIANGVEVKRWEVEPIVFKETEEGFKGHPEFEDIKARLSNAETLCAALAELTRATDVKVKQIDDTINGIDDIVNDPLN